MATLITGLGLVGTSFAQHALKRKESLVFYDMQPRMDFLRRKLGDAKVAVVQKDIRDLPALVETIQTHRIDTVVHTAGLIGRRVAESMYTGMQINVVGTMNVAEAVRLAGVRRLVHISTFGVYDRRLEGSTPITEDFHRGAGAAYSNSKVAKELIVEAYQNQFGFELMVLRFANVYGLGHFWGGSSGGEKIQAMLECGLRGEIARIPQEETRDFEYVYAKDAGRAIELAATVSLPGKRVFNIGEGRVRSFEEIVGIIKKLLPGLRVEIIPGKTAPLPKQPMDLSRAREILGWEPQFTMERAFEDYLRELRAAM